MSRQAAAALRDQGICFIGLSESSASDEEGEGMTNGEGMRKRGRTYTRVLYASATIQPQE